MPAAPCLRSGRSYELRDVDGRAIRALTLRRPSARARAEAGLDEVTRTALAQAEETAREDAQPVRDNVVALAGRPR